MTAQLSMESTSITAIAALSGSLAGAAATIVTTWITQRAQGLRAEKEEELRERQALYGEFITEASRLTVDALSHSLERPETMVKLYGILGRIRLVAADLVLGTAEACCRQIIELYSRPNMTVEEMRVAFEQEQVDPLREFSTACRKELLEISGGRRRRRGGSGYETNLTNCRQEATELVSRRERLSAAQNTRKA